MASLNKVILIGNITKDLELKKTQSDISVCTFAIGVQRRFKTDGKYESDFINIVAWRQTAEFVVKFFKKGSAICIVGSLQTRNYEKDGVKHYITEVVADEASFVDKSEKGDDSKSEPPKQTNFVQLGPDEDLPF